MSTLTTSPTKPFALCLLRIFLQLARSKYLLVYLGPQDCTVLFNLLIPNRVSSSPKRVLLLSQQQQQQQQPPSLITICTHPGNFLWPTTPQPPSSSCKVCS